MRKKLFILLTILFVLPLSAQAETIFVTDSLKLKLRAQASNDAEVVTNLDSGQELTVLEKQKSYTRVRTSEGKEGWVQSWLLTDKPPATFLLNNLTKGNESLTTKLPSANAKLKNFDSETARENEELRSTIAELTGKITSLNESKRRLELQVDSQISELAKYEFAKKYNLNLIILIFFLLSFFAGVISYRVWAGRRETKRLWGYQLAH